MAFHDAQTRRAGHCAQVAQALVPVLVPGLVLGLVLGLVPGAPCRADSDVDFTRDVRPILSDRCFVCHGPDASARQAGLRLDTRDGLLGVTVPGRPDDSELVHRIAAADPRDRMPPADSGLELTGDEIDLLRAWIAGGAEWRRHWAFEPPRRPDPADLPSSSWVRNPIDRFVLARLARAGLAPAPPESPARLLRRVTLDLTGLPPTLEEIDRFLANDDPHAPDAWAGVVDRLLESAAYGERMAWDWLDVARYSDTNGFQHDAVRSMWPWRDWVVGALNENLPFDRFTVWQLAGDLLPEPTTEQRLATAFSRNHMINGEGGRIPAENRVEYVFDQVETVGTAWMGLTLYCCRCHDHKFDPIPQTEYYRLFDFFNQTPVDGSGADPHTAPTITVDEVRVMVMEDRPERRETNVLERGLYSRPGDTVSAGVPSCLPPLPADAPPNRLALAEWLVAPGNPLTARVTVNRAWQMLFGAGLVETPGDFGTQGRRPSHPDLLDWLAVELVESGWDLKTLHRLMVTSATYRQASAHRDDLAAVDPKNRLLGRGPRHRLPAWMIRDQALAASGLLVRDRGGPPVKPYQPAGVWSEATFGTIVYEQDHGPALYRRSLYTFWRRIQGPTMLFDSADRKSCAVRPVRTNTPLHALVTLNDTTYVEAARALAERVLTAAGSTDGDRVDLAFRLAAARRPDPDERHLLLKRLELLAERYAGAPDEAGRLLEVGESPRDETLDPVEHASWTALCTLILNLDEVLTK